MKIAVVLNYCNYNNTITCVKRLLKAEIEKVIVVDNASPNDSVDQLRATFNQNNAIVLIFSSQNKGYAAGNNLGLHYIDENCGRNNIIFIVNPDVVVNRVVITKIADFINVTPNAGMVTVRANDTIKNVWKQPSRLRGWVMNSHLLKWLLARLHISEMSYYKVEQPIQKVDVVLGAFFGIRQSTFRTVGYFDPGTFLYYEEEILACKLKQKDFQNYILTAMSYQHVGQTSTKLRRLSRDMIYQKSRLYFLKSIIMLAICMLLPIK